MRDRETVPERERARERGRERERECAREKVPERERRCLNFIRSGSIPLLA